MFTREGMFLLFSSLLFYAFALTGRIAPIHGIIFIIIYAVYLFYIAQNEIFKGAFTHFLRDLFRVRTREDIDGLKKAYRGYKEDRTISNKGKSINWLFAIKQFMIIAVSCFALYFSSKYLIPAAHNIAIGIHVPDTIIGITLLAIGTSLPELTVSIIAARKAKGDLLIGNIIGSNIANILLVIGVSSIISPLAVTTGMVYFFMPVMLLITILLLGFIRANWVVRMIDGFVFLVLYAVFIAAMIYLVKMGFLSGTPWA
jgi:cation:H+ antiporter